MACAYHLFFEFICIFYFIGPYVDVHFRFFRCLHKTRSVINCRCNNKNKLLKIWFALVLQRQAYDPIDLA